MGRFGHERIHQVFDAADPRVHLRPRDAAVELCEKSVAVRLCVVLEAVADPRVQQLVLVPEGRNDVLAERA